MDEIRSDPTAPTDPTAGTDETSNPPVDRLLSAVVAVAVLAGVALRFLPRSALWLDEALSANIAGLPLGDIPEALRHDGHPPLYYVLLHFWGGINDSDWWLRALSGVISLASLPLTYLAGRRVAERLGASQGGLGARRTGSIALAVAATMPFGIRYAAEVRMYALVIALVTGGYLVVDDLLTARRTGTARTAATVGAAMVAAALLWTHYWSIWLLAAVGLLALWRVWREPDPDRRTGARLLVAALVAGGLLFLPWLPSLLYQSAHTGTPWGEQYGPASVVVFTLVDFAGARFGIAHLFTYLLVPLLLLAAFARRPAPGADDGDTELVIGTRVTPLVRSELVVIALALAIGWGTARVSGNTFSSRYASVVFPLFLLAVAAGIAVFRSRVIAAAALALVIVTGAWGSLGETRGDRTQAGELAEVIREDLELTGGPGAVVACPDQIGVSLQRSLEQALSAADVERIGRVVPYPTGDDPRFVDWVDYSVRNSDADPAAFVELLSRTVSDDATIYLAMSPGYQTFGMQCEQLLGLLSAGRDVVSTTPVDDGGLHEAAGLWILRPRSQDRSGG